MTTIISVCSSKGGSGKTTTATTLASGLAKFERTLLVDFDAQGHAALAFGLPVKPGVYNWIVCAAPLEQCTLPGRPELLTILPGDSYTKAVEGMYTSDQHFATLVGNLRSLDYPFVIIDTNPSGLLAEVALAAADLVIVPFRPEPFGMDGLYASLELMSELAPHAQMRLLPAGYDQRLREHRDNLRSVQDKGPLHPIRARVAVMDAQSRGQSIWEYKRQGSGIVDVQSDYDQLVGVVMEMGRQQWQSA